MEEGTQSLEQLQARHRRELKELQGRITNKKKNATKKTRKGVNDECAQLESQLREKQAAEVAAASGTTQSQDADADADADDDDGEESGPQQNDEYSSTQPTEADSLQKLEEKLEKAAENLHINGRPDPPLQPGKKRNRQKERLARRAAEQEAAAQKAEDEASSMTDYRARESKYMKEMFTKYELVEKEIEPDGHCLFSAVADQLAQNDIPVGGVGVGVTESSQEAPYKTVRRVAAAFMSENRDDFAPFLEEDLELYVARIRDTAEWGGQLELTALARRYGAEIRVVQDGRMEKIGEEEGARTGKMMWLAYYRHGYGLGEHYNSLRKKGVKS
ncbi:OTU protein [Conoideocrella luteorostrata]|uniref:OTU protein n=1 Tax=Conoideocrella luteorostrata TaxID=1105319 RepID=A0AAJ0CWX7_9HYPO|nr:OTU protein [Conoideocrella luteorostrata]